MLVREDTRISADTENLTLKTLDLDRQLPAEARCVVNRQGSRAYTRRTPPCTSTGQATRTSARDHGRRKLRQLLANGASHRAAARAFKLSEGTVRRAVQHDSAVRRSPP